MMNSTFENDADDVADHMTMAIFRSKTIAMVVMITLKTPKN